VTVEATPLAIADLLPEHWPQVAEIYREGIATGNATFETEVPAWEQWNAAHLAGHRFVALRDGEVVGWAAVTPVSDRCVYGGVVENSVYVAGNARGQGVGRTLLEALVTSTEAPGSGRSRPASSRRTRRASGSTNSSASRSSGAASGSAS
jgi:L-amino acid N-acyltransferase YncA